MDRNREFAELNELDYPLLSDTDREIARAFGVRRFGPIPSRRATFVIGPDRRILEVITSELNVATHTDRALEVLRDG